LVLIVEISRGDVNKYEYNSVLGVIELDRVLSGPWVYPVNYCDVPQTWNEGDNDPLDAVLFSIAPIVPGVLAIARVIGALELIDNGDIDHKIICVNAKDPRYAHVEGIDGLTPYERRDLITFFQLYKIPETGMGSVRVGKFWDKSRATLLIETCLDAYRVKFKTSRRTQ
jgi:inorganic pyrophosphatase